MNWCKQACLKEIHAKMLRKHLQRLEPPLEDHDKLENDHSLRASEEENEHDIKGIFSLSFLVK